MGQHKSESDPVKLLGLEFAPRPWAIPWERRIQTLTILVWFIICVVWPLFAYQILAVSFIYTFTYPTFYGMIINGIIFAYLLWMWIFDMETCHRGGRRSSFVRSLSFWKHFNQYFPIKLIKTADLDPSRNYLFGGHPHGLLCIGIFGGLATDGNEARKLFPGFEFSLLTFDTSFMAPFVRELILWLGLCSASRRSMNHVLSQPGGGRVGIIIPGGAPEALDFCPGTYILQLKKRKGFIKVAMQNGSPLVPVFAFGENVVLNQIPNPRGSVIRWMQDKFQQLFTIPPVFFYGRGVFQYTMGFLPKRQPITVVVGAPISVEKVNEPTQAQIDDLHEKYVNSLTQLFLEHRGKYSADPNDTLVIT